jgi:hypothetical protein
MLVCPASGSRMTRSARSLPPQPRLVSSKSRSGKSRWLRAPATSVICYKADVSRITSRGLVPARKRTCLISTCEVRL